MKFDLDIQGLYVHLRAIIEIEGLLDYIEGLTSPFEERDFKWDEMTFHSKPKSQKEIMNSCNHDYMDNCENQEELCLHQEVKDDILCITKWLCIENLSHKDVI